MEICGEHGLDIVYAGRSCPACDQIEDINDSHYTEIDELKSDFDFDLDNMQDRIDELEIELEDIKSS